MIIFKKSIIHKTIASKQNVIFLYFNGTWSYTYSKEIQVQHEFKANEK